MLHTAKMSGLGSNSLESSGLALDSTLSNLSDKINLPGQKTMSDSVPVVIASDQSALTLQEGGVINSTASSRVIQLGAVDLNGKARAINITLEGGQILCVQDEANNSVLQSILIELKKISFYLSQMSDISTTNGDIE